MITEDRFITQEIQILDCMNTVGFLNKNARKYSEDINAWIDQRENKMKYFVHNEHV